MLAFQSAPRVSSDPPSPNGVSARAAKASAPAESAD